MSTIEEWEEMHLTPEGWIDGSYRLAPGEQIELPRPATEVLTIRRHVVATYGGASRVTEDRTPRTDDMPLIERLLQEFGAPVFKV
jgi:hypothetical protein